MNKFSIIIPVRSINNFLKENITHLKKLNYDSFEVLIILDNEEAFDLDGDTRFKLLAVGPKGPGEKRNIGASAATGNILVFLDDDAYPKSDWLQKADHIFSNEDIYALGAPGVTPLNANFLEKSSGYVFESYLAGADATCRYTPQTHKLVNDYPTVNLFVKKNSFMAVGGFNTEFWPGEDTKLCLDLVKYHKKSFLYSPIPIVYHHRRTLFVPHLKQISRYGTHRGQFARIYPETSRVPSYFVPSLFVLGIVLGPLVSFLLPTLWYLYIPIVTLYMVLLFVESLRASLKEKNILVLPFVALGIFLTHLVYGTNFVNGFIKRPKLQLRGIDKTTGNYLGG